MIKNKALAALVLAAVITLTPLAQAAAPNQQPHQSLTIESTGLSAPFTANYMAAQALSGNILLASVFGNNYWIRVGDAVLVNSSGATISMAALRNAKTVSVLGAYIGGPFQVTARRVQVMAPDGQPLPDDVPPPPAGESSDDHSALSLQSGDSGGGDSGGGGVPLQLLDPLYRHALTGENIDNAAVRSELRSGGGAVTQWNSFGGSQNLALVAHAALGDYKFLSGIAEFSKYSTGGVFNKELGSPGYYFAAPTLAFMVALRDAKKFGDTEAVNVISSYLRSHWALWSLATVPTKRTSAWLNHYDRVQTTGSSGKFQPTPTVALAGERWGTVWGGAIQPDLYSDRASYYVSWALGLSRGDVYAAPVVKVLAGVTKYNQNTPADIWGISDADRTLFKEIVNGNRSRLGEVLKIIEVHGVYNHLIRIRRTTNGVETIFFKSLNGNKPTHAATNVTNQGAWKGIRPCLDNTGSNPGYKVSVANGIITATGNPSNCRTVSMPELDGQLIYSVVLEKDRAYEGNVTSVDGVTIPPAPSGSSPDDGDGRLGDGGGGAAGDEEPPLLNGFDINFKY